MRRAKRRGKKGGRRPSMLHAPLGPSRRPLITPPPWHCAPPQPPRAAGPCRRRQVEFDKEEGEGHGYVVKAMPHLMPTLLATLERQNEDADEDDYYLAASASQCVGLIAQVGGAGAERVGGGRLTCRNGGGGGRERARARCEAPAPALRPHHPAAPRRSCKPAPPPPGRPQCAGDAVIEHVLPYVSAGVGQADWRKKEAAIMAFANVLDGPDSAKLAPIVSQVK